MIRVPCTSPAGGVLFGAVGVSSACFRERVHLGVGCAQGGVFGIHLDGDAVQSILIYLDAPQQLGCTDGFVN